MKSLKVTAKFLLAVSFAITMRGQDAPSINQTAKNSCANIVALSGSKVDCNHLTTAQSKAISEIPSILRMALQNKDYLQEILEKLNEISIAETKKPCVPSPGGNTFNNMNASGGLYGVVEAGRGDCWNGGEAKGGIAGVLSAPNGYIPGVTPPSIYLTFSVKNKPQLDGSQEATVEIVPLTEIEDPFILIYFSNPFTKLINGSIKMTDGGKSIVEQPRIELEKFNDAPNSPDDPNLLGLKFIQPHKLTSQMKISLSAILSSQGGPGVARVCLIAKDLKSCN